MISTFDLKAGDIKECCIAIPDIKDMPGEGHELDGVMLTANIRKCTKGAEAVAVPVEVSDDLCRWCMVIDTTALDGAGEYELEFEIAWADPDDDTPRVCHYPPQGFLGVTIAESIE